MPWNNKISAYILIWWATFALIIIIAWLLGAFQSEPKIIIPNIQTNNIIEQTTTLPQTCQNTISFMDCIISSPLLSWAKESLWQSYAQLISEWNVITDPAQLDMVCSQHYTYLLSLEDETYRQAIESCRTQ